MRTAEWVQAQLNRDHPGQFVTAKQRGDSVMLVRRDGKVAAWLTSASLAEGDDVLKTRVDHCVAFLERYRADDAAPQP